MTPWVYVRGKVREVGDMGMKLADMEKWMIGPHHVVFAWFFTHVALIVRWCWGSRRPSGELINRIVNPHSEEKFGHQI